MGAEMGAQMIRTVLAAACCLVLASMPGHAQTQPGMTADGFHLKLHESISVADMAVTHVKCDDEDNIAKCWFNLVIADELLQGIAAASDYEQPVHTVRLALANKRDAGNFARGTLMLMRVLEPELTRDERVDLLANLLSRYSKDVTPNTVSGPGFDYEMVTISGNDAFEARRR